MVELSLKEHYKSMVPGLRMEGSVNFSFTPIFCSPTSRSSHPTSTSVFRLKKKRTMKSVQDCEQSFMPSVSIICILYFTICILYSHIPGSETAVNSLPLGEVVGGLGIGKV